MPGFIHLSAWGDLFDVCRRQLFQFVDVFAQPLPLKKQLGKIVDGWFWCPSFGPAHRVGRDHLNRWLSFAVEPTYPVIATLQ